MTNSGSRVQALPMASMLALIVFTTVWGFASSAVFTVQPHSLRNHLLEIGKPIQAVAIPANIAPDLLAGHTTVETTAESLSRPRSTIEALSAPVAALVEQLKDPLSIRDSDVTAKDRGHEKRARKNSPMQASSKKSDEEPKNKGLSKSGSKARGRDAGLS